AATSWRTTPRARPSRSTRPPAGCGLTSRTPPSPLVQPAPERDEATCLFRLARLLDLVHQRADAIERLPARMPVRRGRGHCLFGLGLQRGQAGFQAPVAKA